jgi:hypothetical protein
MIFRLVFLSYLRITILIGTQKVTVFSPEGAYLAVAGGKEVRSPVTFTKVSYFMVALVVRLDGPRACVHEDTSRPG